VYECESMQGLAVSITMWDKDDDPRSPIPYDMIDEFVFDFTEPAGLNYTEYTMPGIRTANKS